MSRHWASCLCCVLLLGGISGCGGGEPAPSDGDIEAAVKAYYAGDHSVVNLQQKQAIGIKVFRQSHATEVHVQKRGEPFTPNSIQSGYKPMGTSSEGYPVRVLVKGTTQKLQGTDQGFDGEADFVVYFLPPDKSKVDSGKGVWVAVLPPPS